MSWHVETRGSGRDLVLLHGWGLHSGVWDEVMPALAARWRVHAVDLPGHGYSARVEADSFDDATDRLAEIVPRDAVVCGWSLGGLVAQRLARKHPSRVARLALVSTTPCFAERPGWPHGMKAAALATFTEGLARDRDGMLRRFVALNALHGPQGRVAVRTFTERLSSRGPPSDRTLGVTLAWLRDVDLREQTRGLEVPAAVVHGGRDMLAPPGVAQWFRQNLPNARLHELPRAAHMPFFSHRAEFVAALEELVA